MATIKKEKYLVTRDRDLMLSPCYFNGISQSHPKTKKLYGRNFCGELEYFYSGRVKVIIPKKDWEEAEDYISEKIISDKRYFKRIESAIEKSGEEIEVFLAKNKKIDFSKLKFLSLLGMLKKLSVLWINYDIVNLMAWYVGADHYNKKIRQILKISEEDFAILSLPKQKTRVSQMESDLLKYGRRREINLITAAEKLAKKYWWIPFGYDGLEVWDKKYFIAKLSGLRKNIKKTKEDFFLEKNKEKSIEKNKKNLLNKYRLNKKQLVYLEKSHKITIFTDDRKKFQFQLHFYFSQIFLELSRRYKVSYKHLKYLFIDELPLLKADKEKLLKISQQRINKDFVVYFDDGKYRILSAKETEKIKKEIAQNNSAKETSGMVASKGPKEKYLAKVKVLLLTSDQKKVQIGDIIVANMTTPEYVPSMKKAIGFVTDEGGVTCHAAIVAREMNKPCIIGTKNATKIFKDGDLAEIDVAKGTIKIIK